jgi:biotin carboxylase
MSARKIAGFVGKPYIEFVEWLVAHEYEVHVFHDQHESYVAEKPPYYTTHPLDFSSKQATFTALSTISIKPAFIVSTYENAILQKAWLCEYYGLFGASEVATLKATDKFEMRLAFQHHCPAYTPRFALVSNWSEIETFLASSNIHFPLILKPTNLFKSLLVTKNLSLEELKANFEEGLRVVEEIYQKEKVFFQPRFILEEYLSGPSYSLEVFTDQTGKSVTVPSVVDLVMGRDLGINDNYNYSRKLPSAATAQQQAEMQTVAVAGVQALGLTASPAHVEMVYTPSGPKLIEIGARTGGYRPRMYRLANGIDLFAAQVQVAQGSLPELESIQHTYCAVYEIFPEEVGEFKGITQLAELKRFASLYYLSVKYEAGQLVGPAKKGYLATAVIILCSEDKATFLTETNYFEKTVKVELS